MVEVKFIYDGRDIIIKCDKNQKMKDICISLSNKINIEFNSLVFLYGGGILKVEKTFEELTKENKINIIVYKNENEEICPKCGRILNNEIINEIILSNNNINSSLNGIKYQIEFIISDIKNKVYLNYINSQLKNINILIDNINDNIKKMINKLNVIKFTGGSNMKLNNNNIKLNNNDNKKEEMLKNEIICIYNKQKKEIKILHDYTKNMDKWSDKEKKSYIEGKNNINDKNIDIYINDKKIKFNYKYESNEKGDIQIKFVFNKLLTSTNHMFYGCTSLKSINLSSFNATNVEDMFYMFYGCYSLQSINLSSFITNNVNNMGGMFSVCSSLKSINLSSFNTTNVKNMSYMFTRCSSLQSINLSSFNTINVINMSGMFSGCSSLKSINLSSFNTTNVNNMSYMLYGCSSLKSINLSSFNTINVINMSGMFNECSSLKSINLSSFNTTNVKNMSYMFYGCSSLKKENVKINNNGKKILDEIN